MNGEPYRADEYGFSVLRTKESFESPSDFLAPADCWGDVAAAGATLHLMLAVIAGAKGYAKGNVAFAWASAEAGERCAALMSVNWGN
jgi:3-oxoacyl-[acyl-carrier-protein] synthase-1